MPEIIRPQNTFQLTRWRQGNKVSSTTPAILHWHGIASSPSEMVFTSDDYNRLYGNPESIVFLQELWRNQQILAVGFSFTDPFFTRVMEQTLRNLECNNRHFALIGYRSPEPISLIARRNFTKKYRLSPIFYKIKEQSTSDDAHAELSAILTKLQSTDNLFNPKTKDKSDKEDTSISVTVNTESLTKRDFERDLLVTGNGQQLYVEPRLYKSFEATLNNEEALLTAVSVQEIVESTLSVIICAPHDYGLTSLGRRLALEIGRKGVRVFIRDAQQLPEYRAKLEKDIAFKSLLQPVGTLILDNFRLQEHERLLKEINGLNCFERIIILAKAVDISAQLEDFGIGDKFDVVSLSHIEREDIRELAAQMYGTSDVDLIAGAVEKVYTDLLDLCIPLTPANVVMYLSVIFKEGDFTPLSRIQIIDHYVRDLLRRPSDVYRDSFNVDNKLDVVSLFAYGLYNERKITFSQAEWSQFCHAYMKNQLISFDEVGLLSDLAASRVLERSNSLYSFRYRLFYSFFIGRYVANRPEELRSFLATNKHMHLEGLVEVISGLSADNRLLVEDLCSKLENVTEAFNSHYGLTDLDPYTSIEWKPLSQEEERKTWIAVTERLANGPAETEEVDKVKRSILAEKRTEHQTVVIHDFNTFEQNITQNHYALNAAINNAVNVSGSLKVRAVNSLLETYLIRLRIGIVFAPLISSRRYFMWNGVGFINRLTYSDEEAADPKLQVAKVFGALPSSLASRAAQDLGSKRLGDVHAYLANEGSLDGFKKLVNFSLVIRSKPNDWTQVANRIIGRTNKNAVYLGYMLSATIKHFREDVNTNNERGLLKRVVAMIQNRREFDRVIPGVEMVTKVVKRLEALKYFEDKSGKS